jgi:membrane-bound lytic murein transglycosylase D
LVTAFLLVWLSIAICGAAYAESVPSQIESKPYSDYAGPPPVALDQEQMSHSAAAATDWQGPAGLGAVPSAIPMTQPRDLWEVISRHFEFQDEATHPAVAYQVHWFLAHRKLLNRMLNNAVPYLYYVYQEVQKKSFPAEVALLPLVESGFSPYAYSSSGATGLWQLMPATAASDGLRINWWYDGRRDVIVSTQSALNYLQSLHSSFHSWPLALSAYNAGQGRVQSALDYNQRMNRPTDFWSLALPAQTRDYFPKLLAIANIITNAKHYGVDLPYIADQPYFQPVTLHSQATLDQMAKMAGVGESVIQRLNPAFRRWATEPNNNYEILIPASRIYYFKEQLANLTGKEDYSWIYHQARGGETLHSIAANYHVNLSLLARVNGLNEDAQVATNDSLLVPLRLHRRFNVPSEQAINNDQVAPATNLDTRMITVDPVEPNDSLEVMMNKLQGRED